MKTKRTNRYDIYEDGLEYQEQQLSNDKLVNRYLRLFRRKRPSTQTHYRTMLRSFVKFVGKREFCRLNNTSARRLVLKFQEHLEAVGNNDRTVFHKIWQATRFLSFLGYDFKFNLPDYTHIDKATEENLLETVLQPDEVEQLLSACSSKMMKVLILTFLDTGARLGELLPTKIRGRNEYRGGIRIKDLKLSQNPPTIFIRYSKSMRRPVHILPLTYQYLTEYLEEERGTPPHDFVFLAARMQAPFTAENFRLRLDGHSHTCRRCKGKGTYNGSFKGKPHNGTCPRCNGEKIERYIGLVEKAGLHTREFKITPHIFRKTTTTELEQLGVPDDEIMAQLGWRSSKMLQRYKGVDRERINLRVHNRRLGRSIDVVQDLDRRPAELLNCPSCGTPMKPSHQLCPNPHCRFDRANYGEAPLHEQMQFLREQMAVLVQTVSQLTTQQPDSVARVSRMKAKAGGFAENAARAKASTSLISFGDLLKENRGQSQEGGLPS